jgi:DNA repair exonuclease SbcCD ATPase subunit
MFESLEDEIEYLIERAENYNEIPDRVFFVETMKRFIKDLKEIREYSDRFQDISHDLEIALEDIETLESKIENLQEQISELSKTDLKPSAGKPLHLVKNEDA